VFHGPTSLALEHFSSLGFICEEHDNPADFILDVINECEKQVKPASITDGGKGGSVENGCNLGNSFTHSQLGKECKSKCDEVVHNLKSDNEIGKKFTSFFSNNYPTNFLWQLFVVIVRSTLNILRNPQLTVIQFIINIIFALIVGFLYLQLDTGPNGYQNRIGAIFFIIMNQIFGNMNAVELFISQKPLFIHENASGFYRVSVYFLAKIICDIIPLRFIPLCFFCVIAYFMIGFQIQADKFFIFFMTMFLTSLASSSIAFFFSALVPLSAIASLLIAMCYVFQMLFGGFLITLESLPVWLQWLQYFSIFRYSVEALAVNEISGLTFNVTINNVTTQEVAGESLLEVQGFDPNWLYYDWLGLFGFILIFTAFTYVVMRLLKKEK
jgi:ATP-binding cassette subfamily G (WHITE) protein 2